jgi:ABC-2 type transport system permease protein
MTTTTDPRVLGSSTHAAGRRLPPALHYTVFSTLLTVKNFGFVIFSIAMPVTLYVVFSKVFGNADVGDGLNYAALIMVSMAAYGSLGAAMSGGAQLALERRSGWFRQLTLTVLPPRTFLWSKAAVIMVIVLPALILVFAAGVVIGGVRAPVGVWLASLALMWIGLVPLTILGIVVGLWVKAEAVQGFTTLLLLMLSLLGGLWFPVEVMPSVMRHIAYGLPSYWLAALGRYPFIPGAAFPWTGVWVLLAWTAGLTVLGALGYRRAAANSKR